MTVLVDTHALLWLHSGDRRLSRRARSAMEAPDAALVISAATVWELSIKTSLGRLQLPSRVDDYIATKIGQGYRLWPVTWEHAAAVASLPLHHRDPFDRMLVVQAMAERWAIVTGDRVFRKYGVDVVW